ncbi:MAG: hypothetical protein IT521_07870 [Burkholderiales bacterium]|nr:hypothetical protein [Burkholderiales bacterium]
MPLVEFRPTKARLVMESARESVLVMKVVLDSGDAVELTTGGSLESLQGVLRIRERKSNGIGNGIGSGVIGSVVYVAETGRDAGATSAKFQINVAMAADKFATLLRVANAGRLPTKFFVDAGGRPDDAGAKALGYRMRAGTRVKVWDNHSHRTLPVTHFVMILPIDVPAPSEGPLLVTESDAPVALATNAQVAELMDDMLVFQSDTRNTMFGLICVLAIVALAALALGLAIFFR